MRLALLAIQMLLLVLPMYGEDAFSGYVPETQMEKLRSGETLNAKLPQDWTLSLLPSISTAGQLSAEVKAQKPTLGVELMRVITGLPQQMDSSDGWLLLYNSLHAVSTMKGIEYYSVSRKRMTQLFSESYAVDAESRKDRIADPVFSEIPAEDVLFTIQEDGSFGKNTYKEGFSFKDDHLLTKIENVSTMMFLIFPLVQPGKLVSRVVIIPKGNEVVFYGISYLTTAFPVTDREHREASLTNRLTAMADWLASRLSAPGQ